MSFWHTLGEQLKHPQGLTGRAVGQAMRIVNKTPNLEAIKALDINPDDTILELGFGPGQALSIMAKQAPQGMIYGFDASEDMVAQASRLNHSAIERGRMTLKRGEFAPIPFPDNALDKILAVNVIYFWSDAPAILAECHRTLRPDGRIVIYATDAASMKNWKFAARDTHIHFTKDGLESALLGGGFTPEGINIETVAITGGITGLIATAQK